MELSTVGKSRTRPDEATATATATPRQFSARYDFGGIPVTLTSENRDFLQLAEQRYGDFASAEPAVWQAVYRVTDSRLPAPCFLRDARRQSMRSRRHGSRLELTTETFEMALDHDRGIVDLAGPLATYPIDRLIQTLWYETWDRSLIIHAAALAEGADGWLMSGPSGSGKSTLAALFPERALCDEFVAVRLDGRAPRLGALPFWTSGRGGAELRGVYLLQHGPSDRRRRLTASEAFARLRREVVWPTFDPAALERAFTALFDLIARVPVWELTFRPSAEVWRLISKEPQA